MRGATCRSGALAVTLVAASALGALLPMGAVARARAIRFKVLGASLYQEATWSSASGTDNGCYTGTFSDSGFTKVFMNAKRGTIVKAVPSGDPTLGLVLKGIRFSGEIYQHSRFTDDWTLDPSASLASCGQPTGPFYNPPSTAGCGVKDVTAANSAVALTIPLGRSPRQPAALVGTFYRRDPFGGSCPSDDPVDAVTPLFVRAKQRPSVFGHRTITLAGEKAVRSSGGMYYRGLEDQSGDAMVHLEWDVKLRRVG